MIPINNDLSIYKTSQINPVGGIGNSPSVGNSTLTKGQGGATRDIAIGLGTGKSQGPKNFVIPSTDRTSELGKIFDDKTLKQVGVIECQTCANRTYVDGSNDPGVSFKTPTHLSPGEAAGAVASHEQEHVVNEQADAKAEGREVVSQSVQIFTSICPECGKTYVSGGVTKTTTAGPANPYAALNKNNAAGNLLDFSL